MTLIELFREKSIHNVVSALEHSPELLVYLVSPAALKKYKAPTEAFFKKRRPGQKILWCPCNTEDLNCLESTLEGIISAHGDCVADTRGSEGLMLLALGKMMQKHPDALGTLSSPSNAPAISVSDTVALMGGSVESSQSPDPELSQRLWRILKKDPDRYNRAITELNGVIEKGSPGSYAFKRPPTPHSKWLIGELERQSLCTETQNGILMERGDFILKAGNALEAKVLWAVRELCDDAVMGAVLDWDGEKRGNDTNNEVDVLISRNARLSFISCKNGSFDENELYKLSAVAEHFCPEDHLKAVVATAMGKLSPQARQRLEQRARDMGIRLISSVHRMGDRELINTLKDIIPR